jgi:hypothetical protein
LLYDIWSSEDWSLNVSVAHFFCGAVPAPPRKAKLQNRSLCPKKIGVWNRLLSVWKRMEAFGNDSKRLRGIWFSRTLFIFERKPQKKYGFYAGISKLVASLDDHNQTTEKLTTINDDILKIANQACLKILADDKLVEIKHKFRFGDKSNLGVMFFLFGGLFLIIAPFIKTSDTTTKIIGIVLGLLLVVFSILTVIRQVADGLQIKDHKITFRHNLKQTIIPLSGNLKIKMKTEVMKIRRVGTLGSDFIIVTHYLQDHNIETPILKFQMDNENADNAKKLGNELSRIINAKFRQ